MAMRDEQFLATEPITSLCDAGFRAKAKLILIAKIHGQSYMSSLIQVYTHSKQYQV